MSASVVLFNPTAKPPRPTQATRPILSGIAGMVVGFIDNAKPNFNFLAEDLADLLVNKYGASRAIKLQKRAASVPAPAGYIDELARDCDLVIAGSGD